MQASGWYDSLAHAWGGPVAQGQFKREIDDFCVDEVLNWQPGGAGEHLCLYVRKRGLTTAEVAQRLARAAGVSLRQVSYAGLKDRQGQCRQWFGLHLAGLPDPDFSAIQGADLQIEIQQRHHRKLRIGSHAGNRFRIRLRDVAGTEEAITARLDQIARCGVPNYFGEQRFGFNGGNLDAVQRWFDGGRRPRDHALRSLLLSTARAVVFNEVLTARVLQGNWNQHLPGDLMNLQGTDRHFAAAEQDEALEARLAELDIHPTGPLWGKGDPPVTGAAAALELAIARHQHILCDGLAARGLQHARRSLRLWPQQLHYARLEENDWLLQFTLPPGSYATVVLRELCDYQKSSAPETD